MTTFPVSSACDVVREVATSANRAQSPTRLIRNFSIIAHIDHGKSTLADRLLDATGALTEREQKAQFLDSMDLERERGITIKAATVRLQLPGQPTARPTSSTSSTPPATSTFTTRCRARWPPARARCWWSTPRRGSRRRRWPTSTWPSNNNLTIVPVINKIDLPAADPESVRRQIEEVIGLDASDAILASAKDGKGIDEILERSSSACRRRMGDAERPLQVLLLDSWYDSLPRRGHPGARGRRRLRPKQKVRLHGRRRATTRFRPSACSRRFPRSTPSSAPARSASSPRPSRTSPTRASATRSPRPARPCEAPLPGFQPAKPMVFAGIFPTDSARYEDLRDALDKLRLNDASFTREPETSAALGFGFRCGFLGLLHMEIVQERLEREYNLDLITTAPTVRFRVRAAQRRGRRAGQPGQVPIGGGHRTDRGADHRRDHPHAAGIRRRASSSCARRSAGRRPG